MVTNKTSKLEAANYTNLLIAHSWVNHIISLHSKLTTGIFLQNTCVCMYALEHIIPFTFTSLFVNTTTMCLLVYSFVGTLVSTFISAICVHNIWGNSCPRVVSTPSFPFTHVYLWTCWSAHKLIPFFIILIFDPWAYLWACRSAYILSIFTHMYICGPAGQNVCRYFSIHLHIFMLFVDLLISFQFKKTNN